jgi:hypothetical protein
MKSICECEAIESGVKFATANPSCGGPPHSKARFARETALTLQRFNSAVVAGLVSN